MADSSLEQSTERLRDLLRQKVPDLLLQAECGGGLELPSPLPWGFATMPTLYELADIAERELHELRLQGSEQQCNHGGTGLDRARTHDDVYDGLGPGTGTGARDGPPVEAVDRAEDERPADGPLNDPHGPAALGSRSPGQEPRVEDQGPMAMEVLARRARPAQSDSPKAEDGGSTEDVAGSAERDGQQAGKGGQGSKATGKPVELREGLSPGVQVEGRDGWVPPRSDDYLGHGSAGVAERHEQGNAAHQSAAEVVLAAADGGYDRAAAPGRVGPGPLPPPESAIYACTAFLEALEQSRTFRSPHCAGAMVDVMGLTELYEGLAGSTLGPLPDREGLEALRALFKDHINSRWALEAVKQGVAAAKQGNYADAHKCYARALELDPNSAEAYVARGAAHANERAFTDAERDLRQALQLDPRHRNASAYLDAVMRHVEAQRQQLEDLERERRRAFARQEEKRQQQPQQQDRRRERGSDAGLGDSGRPVGHGLRSGSHGSAPVAGGGSQQQWQECEAGGGAVQAPAVRGGRRARRDRESEDSGSSSSGLVESSSDGSGRDTPGHGAGTAAGAVRPASDDIKRALEVVLKARKDKRKSKHKKHKKKHKKSKRRRQD